MYITDSSDERYCENTKRSMVVVKAGSGQGKRIALRILTVSPIDKTDGSYTFYASSSGDDE